MKPDTTSPEPTLPRSGFRTRYRLLITLAVLFIAVVFVFPVAFRPGIETPTDLQFGSPFSLPIQISNQNMTPLMDVEYTCEASLLTLAQGAPANEAKVLTRGSIKKIPGRRGIHAHCGTAYIPNAPLKAIEYKLTLAYRPYPWRDVRTSLYLITAQVDSHGQVTAWKVH
jgi:hypothetical protein